MPHAEGSHFSTLSTTGMTWDISVHVQSRTTKLGPKRRNRRKQEEEEKEKNLGRGTSECPGEEHVWGKLARKGKGKSMPSDGLSCVYNHYHGSSDSLLTEFKYLYSSCKI